MLFISVRWNSASMRRFRALLSGPGIAAGCLTISLHIGYYLWSWGLPILFIGFCPWVEGVTALSVPFFSEFGYFTAKETGKCNPE